MERAAPRLGVEFGRHVHGRNGQRAQPVGLAVGQSQAAGAGFGPRDVGVDHGGEAPDRIGHDGVDLDRRRLQPGQRAQLADVAGLGQDAFQHVLAAHQHQHPAGIGREQNPPELAPHPFGGKPVEHRRHLAARGERVPVGRRPAVGGEEAEEAQHAQRVLLDPLDRVADEADASVRQIPKAVERVVDVARRIARQRVHGEIAPRRVGDPVVGERDLGAAAVGFDVDAQRGDFEMLVADHGGHRAVLDSGRDRANAGGFQQRHHRFRPVGGGDVDVLDRPVGDGVAHAAADEAHLGAVAGQRGDGGLGFGGLHPRLRRQLAGRTDGLGAVEHVCVSTR